LIIEITTGSVIPIEFVWLWADSDILFKYFFD